LPVVFLYGVSKFLFSALALAFCLSLLASFVVAMTVIPLFCSRFLKQVPHAEGHGVGPSGARPGDDAEGHGHKEGEYEVEPEAATDRSWMNRFNAGFNRHFNKLLDFYEYWVRRALARPGLTVALLAGVFLASLAIYPFLGLAFFPRTDAGQFTINLKAPTGTRIEVTEQYVAKVENLIRQTIDPKDFKLVVSNIGVVPDFSSLYTTNAGEYTATVQVELQDDHRRSSFDYMQKVQDELSRQDPEIRTFFSSGSMVDAILNMGMPAPIDVQVSSSGLEQSYGIAEDLASQIRKLPGVGQVYIPQDMNYPALRLDVDRVHAGELGLSQKDVVDNVITALNSNLMIAPNYWVDRKTGNDYFLTVQYFEHGTPAIHDSMDLKNIPLRAPNLKEPTTLDNVVKLTRLQTPTEVDHYQIQRVSDVYVTPVGEDLGKLTTAIRGILARTDIPSNVRVNLRGMVNGMEQSFKSFGLGFLLSFMLLFLILVAQFRSFVDPFLIMLAIPMGFIGVLIILPLTHSTMNVMSLMGVLMLVGIADSNSILIVDFAHNLETQGMSPADAVITACRVRLRPILMTSLATIIGMIPMAMKLGTGAEQYTPMARAIIGGLTSSVILTIFIVPAAYLLVYGGRQASPAGGLKEVGE
ncbi:MAG: efflux RND transporter permease subunit, partial [Terriglobia bacterium]